MSRSVRPFRAVSLMIRTALISLALAAPVLAVPAFGDDKGQRIEAPAPKKIGAGFVLLVSLQR